MPDMAARMICGSLSRLSNVVFANANASLPKESYSTLANSSHSPGGRTGDGDLSDPDEDPSE